MRSATPTRVDAVLAVAALLALELDVFLVEPARGPRHVTATGAALLAGSLAARRTRPVLMAGTAAAALLGTSLLDGWLTSMLTTAIVAMGVVFSAALHLARRPALLAGGLVLVASWLDLLLEDESDYSLASDIVFTGLVVVGLPFFAGRALRDRRLRADELEVLTEELKAEREQRAALAVLDERTRIAREMHDVVAHSVSLMVVQAGAARRTLGSDPERARTALLNVEDAGREALAELRRVLGVLRGDDAAAPIPDLQPQPSRAQLPQLVERARISGLDVRLEVHGEPRPLSAGADLVVYRVVQEALTNAVKHAPGSRAEVRMQWGEDALEVLVTDDGPGASGEPGRGHGLVGMRERVHAHGGSLSTGDAAGGGFAVRARLPLGERA